MFSTSQANDWNYQFVSNFDKDPAFPRKWKRKNFISIWDMSHLAACITRKVEGFTDVNRAECFIEQEAWNATHRMTSKLDPSLAYETADN